MTRILRPVLWAVLCCGRLENALILAEEPEKQESSSSSTTATTQSSSSTSALPRVPLPPRPSRVVASTDHTAQGEAEAKPNKQQDTCFQGDFGAFCDNSKDGLDERTLLDVFGEAAKEFLTQRVIPATDEQCRWDWRSVRCEPACECHLEAKMGDYHLGRACRLREQVDEECVPIDPASIWQDTPVTRRILSLVTQSASIVQRQLLRGWEKAMRKASQRFSKMQHSQCDDLWKLYQEQAQSRTCLPPALVPYRSLPQRVLCGPVDFNVCEENPAQDAMTRPAFVERA